MSNDFNKYQNNGFYNFFSKVADMIILSVLWLLFSIPIITMGAASSALYYLTIKSIRQENGSPAKYFIKSFKLNLKQGILLNIIYLIYFLLFIFDIYVARHGIAGVELPKIYENISYFLILPIIFTISYCFPYISRFENSIKNILINCFILSASHLGHTILLIVIIVLCVGISIIFPPLAIVLPGVSCYASSFIIENDFRIAMKMTEDEYYERFQLGFSENEEDMEEK